MQLLSHIMDTISVPLDKEIVPPPLVVTGITGSALRVVLQLHCIIHGILCAHHDTHHEWTKKSWLAPINLAIASYILYLYMYVCIAIGQPQTYKTGLSETVPAWKETSTCQTLSIPECHTTLKWHIKINNANKALILHAVQLQRARSARIEFYPLPNHTKN